MEWMARGFRKDGVRMCMKPASTTISGLRMEAGVDVGVDGGVDADIDIGCDGGVDVDVDVDVA